MQSMRLLFKFFLLTFMVSWIAWIGAAAIPLAPAPQPAGFVIARGFLYFLGVFAPSLVALAITAQADGRAAALAVLRQTVKWSVGARWYVFALTYMAAIKLGTALLLRIVTGAWPPFGQESVFIILIAIPFSTPVQAGEEIGWRGFALPRLSARVGLPGASLALGVIWASWHLPFFFISGNDKTGQSFSMYLLMVTALSVAMAWLYWRTDGSLLLTMLIHAAINNTQDVVPSASSSFVAWLSVAMLWICASFFLVRMRGANLGVAEPVAAG